MHSGCIETSQRLQQTFNVLKDTSWHTGEEIYARTNSKAIHSDIAALRENLRPDGYEIEQEYRGKSEKGFKISCYRLIKGATTHAKTIDDPKQKLLDDARAALASFSGIERDIPEVEKIRVYITELKQRFPGLN
jgi:hypothetical protein